MYPWDKKRPPRRVSLHSDDNDKKTHNTPGVAGVLAGVPDFAFAFVRFVLGACVESSSGSCLLEDEVEEEESLLEVDADSGGVCAASGTANC